MCLFLIEVQLVYNVALVSAVQKSDSVIYIHTHTDIYMYVYMYTCVYIYMNIYFLDFFPF